MGYTMDRVILGDFADQGFSTREYDGDESVTLVYKGKEVQAWPQTGPGAATKEQMRDACQSWLNRMAMVVAP